MAFSSLSRSGRPPVAGLHGYAVDIDSLKGGLEVSHVDLNDVTIKGLNHKELPIVSIQYHIEGSPGPMDNTYLFQRLSEMVRDFLKRQ